MDQDMTTQDTGARQIGRRDLLKKGAMGAGVVGVVWAAPAIEGLTLSPAYGVAASGGCHGTFLFDVKLPRPSTQHASVPKQSGCVGAVTNSDWNGQRQTVTSTLVGGGPGCSFTNMNFDGKHFGQAFFGAFEVTSPTPGGTTISAQFISDQGNANGDLGPPVWGDGNFNADGNNKADPPGDGTNGDGHGRNGTDGDQGNVNDGIDGDSNATGDGTNGDAANATPGDAANTADGDTGTAHITVTCL